MWPTQTQNVYKMEVTWAITMSSYLLTVVLRGDSKAQSEHRGEAQRCFSRKPFSSLHLALTYGTHNIQMA